MNLIFYSDFFIELLIFPLFFSILPLPPSPYRGNSLFLPVLSPLYSLMRGEGKKEREKGESPVLYFILLERKE
jgi:hypothetical protein